MFLDHYLEPSLPTTPLIQAAFNDKLGEVTRLVEAEGVNLEDTGFDKRSTALVASAYLSRINIMKYLINQGANVQATNISGMTSLHIAVYMHDLEYVRQQLRFSTEALEVPDDCGVLPILNKCLYDRELIAFIRKLTEERFGDRDQADPSKVIELLVENGAELDQTKDGLYPIELAFTFGQIGVVTYLRDKHSPEIRFEPFMNYYKEGNLFFVS